MIDEILKDLQSGSLKSVYENKANLNEFALFLLQDRDLLDNEVEQLRKLLYVCNITYNNTDRDILPIEDGIYDMLVEKYRKYTDEDIYPVGAPPILFDSAKERLVDSNETKPAFMYESDDDLKYQDEMLFPEILNNERVFCKADYIQPAFTEDTGYISKRTHNTSHSHPDLVGTFDKCKYVLISQAEERGVVNDDNVRIVERDFFQPLITKGIIDPSEEYVMIAQLKYDGVSVEADVTDIVESARSRGDTENSVAVDMTPILYGYSFPRVKDMRLNMMNCAGESVTMTPIGIKFEAIVNYYNINRINELKNYNYKNGRTAIIGITGSSDAYKYRDLITLVPISTDMKNEDGTPVDRLDELRCLNDLYATDELMRYSIIKGNYLSLLFQMKKYVEEAEYARSYLPFMYDGVVFEFYGKLREVLGRDHSIDRYKVAVKFNPQKKQTIFREYKYTIGQDGRITPMIYYDPVEFFGTIHPKSSGHSYKRFKELDLHVGDVIDVEYTNDVMPYVSKPDNEHNRQNALNPHNELDTFPTVCPSCGTPLTISPTGKTAYCTNSNCGNRAVARMASTFEKLGVADFKEERIKAVNLMFLNDYLDIKDEKAFDVLGPETKNKLFSQLNDLKAKFIWDYDFIGSLGFTNIAKKTWKLIFNKVHLIDLYNMFISAGADAMANLLKGIKGIGTSTIETICNEFPFFLPDIECGLKVLNISSSKGISSGKQIRFTGCRDAALCKKLNDMGYDADGNAGITKSTDILLVPSADHTSSKITKAKKYGIRIVPINDFINNMSSYL